MEGRAGYEFQECIGKSFLAFVHADDRHLSEARFRSLVEDGDSFCRDVIRYTTQSGGVRRVDVYVRLTKDESGTITGTAGALTDISEQQETLQLLKHAKDELKNRVAEGTGELRRA
jgi:PAS domain S-box-containing protein